MKNAIYFVMAVIFLTVSHPARSDDKPSIPESCWAPMPPGEEMVFRTIRLVPRSDGTLAARMCVAFRETKGLADFSARVGIFQKNGRFLQVVNGTYGETPPLDRAINGPGTAVMYDATIKDFDKRYVDDVLDYSLIEGYWSPCAKKQEGEKCIPGPTRSFTYLSKVLVEPRASKK